MAAVKETIEDVKKLEADKYKYGFTTDIEQEFAMPRILCTKMRSWLAQQSDWRK